MTPIAVDEDGSLGIDRDIDRRAIRITAQAGPGIELHQLDVTEVRAIHEPHAPVGPHQYAGIDGIQVLDAVGPNYRTGIFPLVVG